VLNVRGLGFEQMSQQPTTMPMPIVYERVTERAQWEYHSVTIDLREDEPLDATALNALGSDGWLLASVTRLERAKSGEQLVYYFVRAA
jgi:hypothetical protein